MKREPVDIKAIRLRLGFTQEDLARTLGLALSTVSKWEQGVMPIPLIPATQSEGFRPAVPIEGGHLFRSNPATLSERSDAGI
jgi:DNA-binding XRE family transcriptional regulator